jgi:RNA polymerase sigma-70 factor (ECF subfamily)
VTHARIQPEILHQSRSSSQTNIMTFSDYYEAHHQQVYRYMLVKTGNREDAHDLTAQVFLAAYENYAMFEHNSQFITWVMGIARNKLVDYYRSKREQVALIAAGDLPHPAPLPEEAIHQKLQLERVTNALDALSEDRQEAIALRLFGGLSNTEIAKVMQKTPAAVGMLIHRGLQDLQTRLTQGDTNHDS